MCHRVTSLIILICLALTASVMPAAADEPPETPLIYHSDTPLLLPPQPDVENRVSVMLELAAPPALAGGGEPVAVATRSARNRAIQAQLLRALATPTTQVLFQTSLVYNGIAVNVSASNVAALGSLPGVAGVHRIAPKQIADAPANAPATASATWNSPLGATGAGVRVGVIDTGIDYTHATFGGPGTPQAYASNDPTILEPGTFPTARVVGGYDFAGNSYDAQGIVGSAIPTPDPDPLDCNGHGTRAASAAAGLGLDAQGRAYAGSYSSPLDVKDFRLAPGIAPQADVYALKIFGCSGTSALLTRAVEWALDPNGDGDPSDRLDVLNVSLGTPFGGGDDPDAVAINNAVQAGMVVVASAGDTNGVFYAIASPGSAQRAITVGASSSSSAASANVSDGAASVAINSARGPQRSNSALKPDLLAPGASIVSAQIGTGDGATTSSGPMIAVPQVTGAVALLRQLYPSWSLDQIKAALVSTARPVQAANAAAPPSLSGAGELNLSKLGGLSLLAYDRESAGGLPFGVAPITQPVTLERALTIENLSDNERSVNLAATTAVTETGVTVEVPRSVTLPPHSTVDVPVRALVNPSDLNYTPDAATALLQNGFPRHFLAEHGGAIEITGAVGARVRPGHVADLSSVAFYLDDQRITDYIRTDNVGDYVSVSPGNHVVRVLWSKKPPTSTPIFTKTVTIQPDQDYTLMLVGREKVFDIAVVNETPDALPQPGFALLHFLNANVAVDANSGPFDVYVNGKLVAKALAASASTSFIPIPVGKHVVTFYPTGKEPIFKNLNAIAEFEAKDGELLLVRTDRQGDEYYCPSRDPLCQAQQRGGITRSAARGPSVAARVPFNIFPKSASQASAATSTLALMPGTQSFTLTLRNTGARNTGWVNGLPGPQTPFVSAFALEATSPPNESLAAGLRSADLQYVGVTNDLAVSQTLANTALFFGTASYGTWSTPHELQVRIYIDANLDGIDDYVLLNTDLASAYRLPASDVFVSPIYRIQPDGSLIAFDYTLWGSLPAPSMPGGADVSAFNTSVMFQTVGVRSLGLAEGQTRIAYHVETRARDVNDFNDVVDRVPTTGNLEYDIANAAVTPVNTSSVLRQRPLFLDTDGSVITGGALSGEVILRQEENLLLLHHHNPPGAQAEVVQLRAPVLNPARADMSPRVYLPMTLAGP